jgi:hypothetical protein
MSIGFGPGKKRASLFASEKPASQNLLPPWLKAFTAALWRLIATSAISTDVLEASTGVSKISISVPHFPPPPLPKRTFA